MFVYNGLDSFILAPQNHTPTIENNSSLTLHDDIAPGTSLLKSSQPKVQQPNLSTYYIEIMYIIT